MKRIEGIRERNILEEVFWVKKESYMYYTVAPRCAISSYPKGRSDHLIDLISGIWCTYTVPVITAHVTTQMPRCQAKMRKSISTVSTFNRLPPSLSQRIPPPSLLTWTHQFIPSPPLARYQYHWYTLHSNFIFHFCFQGNLLPVSLQFLPIFLFFSILLSCFSLSL